MIKYCALIPLVLCFGRSVCVAVEDGTCVLRGVVKSEGQPEASRVEARLVWRQPIGVQLLEPSAYRDGIDRWLDMPSSSKPSASVSVGANGEFLLESLDRGTYEIRTSSGKVQGTSVVTYVHFASAGARKRIAMRVDPGPHVLRGKALSKDGASSQAWILATQAQYGRSAAPAPKGVLATRVAADGSFRISGLERGRARLIWLVPGSFRYDVLDVEVPHEEPIRLVSPETERTVAGVVVDGASQPVLDARILIRKDTEGRMAYLKRAFADDQGRFSTQVPTGATWLHVSAAGFEPTWVKVSEDSGSRVELRRLGSISGRVVGSVGRDPVIGAVVHALPRERVGNTPAMHAVTDENGCFVLPGVPTGETMVFVLGGGFSSPLLSRVRDRGFNPWLFTVQTGRDTKLELTAERTARATGRMLTQAGEAVVGAIVSARPDAPRQRPGTIRSWLPTLIQKGVSDAGGFFKLDTLLPGERYVLVGHTEEFADCCSPPIHFDSGEHVKVDLRAPRARWVDVHVRSERGAPIPGAEIFVKPHWSRRPCLGPQGARADARGRVLLGPLPPGRLEVFGRAAGYLDTRWVDFGPEYGVLRRSFSLTIPSPWWIRGRLFAPEDLPPASVNGEYQDPWTDRWWPLTFDSGGGFAIPGHPGRPYAIRARAMVGDRQWDARTTADPGSEGVALRLSPVAKAPPNGPPRKPWVIRVRSGSGRLVSAGSVSIHEIPAGGRGGGQFRSQRFDHRGILYAPSSRDSQVFLEVVDMVDESGAAVPGAGFLGPFRGEPSALKIDLGRRHQIRGWILDELGAPIRGAVVAARPKYPRPLFRSSSRMHGRARSNADGSFQLSGLPLEHYGLVVDAGPVRSQLIEVGAPADNVVLRVRRETPVRIRVLHPSGGPLIGAVVHVGNQVVTSRGPLPWSTTKQSTDLSGEAVFLGLGAGPRRLSIEVDPLLAHAVLPFDDENWRPQDTIIQLMRAFTIRGRVGFACVDQRDVVVCYRKVGTHEHKHLEVSDAGTFLIPQLSEGEYELWTSCTRLLRSYEALPGKRIRVRSGATGVKLHPPERR